MSEYETLTLIILYIRGMRQETPHIDPSLLLRLEIEAKHRGMDVSELLKKAIQQFLGSHSRNEQNIPKDPSKLEQLAGTWTQEEFEEFNRNTKSFGEIKKRYGHEL